MEAPWFYRREPPNSTVSLSEVPESFCHLIPFVERWAIACDVIRGDYFSMQPQADIDAFYQAVRPYLDALHEWVSAPPHSEAKIQFLTMLKAHSEAVPPPPPEQIAENRRQWAAEREAKRKYWKEVYQRTKKPDA